MANLSLHHIYKVYDNGAKAVNDFNLDIQDNEFIVFVGPSGCGKSTTLRMIAGLESITSGELFIDDVLVNDLEPKDRDIAFVFQNYALYPHMTVYENMAYGLKNRHVAPEEIDERVLKAAKMLGIHDQLEKLPKEMSGGQRQRVALGRALVRDPKVFLLDEPLSNLDAKLRTQMRSEIVKLHNQIKTTFIYVTHDQTEAMTMGTRIVVMKDGYIQQIDSPLRLYNRPLNKFIAGFIGTPQMNFYDVKLLKNKDTLLLEFDEKNLVEIPYKYVSKIEHSQFNKEVTFGCRPENVIISDKGLPCTVNLIEQLGTESILYGTIALENKTYSVISKIPSDSPLKINDQIFVSFNLDHLHFFDKETEETIIKDTPEKYVITTTVENQKLKLFDQYVTLPECMQLIDGEYKITIPSNALVDGNDLTLSIDEQDNNLIRVYHNDTYYHFIYNQQLEGNKLNCSILFEKLTFENNQEVVFTPINESIELEGYLKREGRGKNIQYYFDIEGNHLAPDYNKIQKVALIDGVNCHKILYKFIINNEDFTISSSGIRAKVIGELNFNNNSYYKVSINDKILYIKKDKDIESDEIYLDVNFENVEIINSITNILIK